MKNFESAKAQFISYDGDTEKAYTLTLGNLVEDADVAAITEIAKGLDTIVFGDLTDALVVESYHISI